MVTQMTRSQEQMARRLRAKGMTLRAIGKGVGYTYMGVFKVLRGQLKADRPDAWTPPTGRLTLKDREEILVGIARGDWLTYIASLLGRVKWSKESRMQADPYDPVSEANCAVRVRRALDCGNGRRIGPLTCELLNCYDRAAASAGTPDG